ncbi:hypothetical protein L2737_17035 [Shewanella electrodiphila]|uniref:Uncharacterized protein n=1 Tax=Shewanella electrodiphila TaxID=934143 RepID=A0ABT0KTW5_9GAMM|nr:helix-turn-helix domain-containing protein [Shewanella electrodiphila]MCL1047006.1 hypothetical protein [Shewanella electrodiphila]
MLGKRTDPKTQSEILAMIAAGYTLAAISKQFGLKYHTVRDIQKRHCVKSGSLKTELVAQYQEALKQSLTSESIKAQASSLLVDDLALATKLRGKLHALMDEISDKPSDTKEAVQVARALTAIASSLKLSNDTLRASFKLGEQPEESDDLPELVVREMLEVEVLEVKTATLEP